MTNLAVKPCKTFADFDAMQQILIARRHHLRHSSTIHTGDLAWWRAYLLRDYDWSTIAFVWETEPNEPVGWSLFTPHYAAFDLFVLPDIQASAQFDTMLDWTIKHASMLAHERGHTAIATYWVFEDDPAWIAALEQHGFARDPGYAMHYLVHPLGDLPAPVLPEVFSLRHVEPRDIEARAAAQRAAFGSTRMTADAYHAVMQTPGYDARLDVIAVDQNTRVAAFALGWHDPANRIGEFEPVGTDPAFQGRGLAKAVVTAGLHRFRALGARDVIVYVEQDNHPAAALYRSAGFHTTNTILAYSKSLA